MPEIDINSDQFADLAGEILASGRTLHFRARGVSMRPCIQDGDLLEIQSIREQDIRIGDILLINLARRQLLVHRVVRILIRWGQKTFLLQGDAAPKKDGYVPFDQVLGQVISIERNDKHVNLNTPLKHYLAVIYVKGLTMYKSVLR
jgi:signal peptidase I